jgi:predicted NUDIX family NTP pyrophosphohydrolase
MASTRQSAGLLMYRHGDGGVEVFLVHPGGPYFARRDAGVWSVPKGEFSDDEDPIEVARREFAEETGQEASRCARGGELIPLGSIVQKGGKRVVAWGFEGDWPAGAEFESNTCTIEWPRKSGRTIEIPEVDQGRFFSVETAREKIKETQIPLVERLLARLESLLG